MKIARSCVFIFFNLLLLTTISIAQSGGITGGKTSTSSTLSGGINLRSIAGAPFSAGVVKESIQVLADGTPARHETHGKMFRDSLGRTRSETELESSVAGVEPKRYVTIVDPVQQVSIVLDLQTKTAEIFHLPAAPAVPARMKLAVAAHANDPRAAAETQDLGAMVIEGFSVTGSRHTRASQAGATQDKAQNTITESWFSPELKIELLSTTQVSQSVTRTTRLTNIVPGEPDPTLFQAPSNYAVQDNSQQR
jgi:hypothetical protein